MGILSLLNNGRIINKKAKLLVDLTLDNGESRVVGDTVSVLIAFEDDSYHIEDNNFATKVASNEILFI